MELLIDNRVDASYYDPFIEMIEIKGKKLKSIKPTKNNLKNLT